MTVVPQVARISSFLLVCCAIVQTVLANGASGNKKLHIDALVEDLFNKKSTDSTKRCSSNSMPMDIGFLVGGYNTESCENNSPDFFQTLEFVKRIAKELRVSKTGNHIGVVLHGKAPKLLLDFSRHQDLESLSSTLNKVSYPGRATSLANALNFTTKKLFIKLSRPNAGKVLIIMTYSKPEKEVKKVSKLLSKAGVSIYTVGLGCASNKLALRNMATLPTHEIYADNDVTLFSKVMKFRNQVCTDAATRLTGSLQDLKKIVAEHESSGPDAEIDHPRSSVASTQPLGVTPHDVSDIDHFQTSDDATLNDAPGMSPSPPNSIDEPELKTDPSDTMGAAQTDLTTTPYNSTSETETTNTGYSAQILQGPDSNLESPPSSPVNSIDVSSTSTSHNSATSTDNLLNPKSTGDGPDVETVLPETAQSVSSSIDTDTSNPSDVTNSQDPENTLNTPLSTETPGTPSSNGTPGRLPESSYSTQYTTEASPGLSNSINNTRGQSAESYSTHNISGNFPESSTSTQASDTHDKGPMTKTIDTPITTSTTGTTDSFKPSTIESTRQSFQETPSTNIDTQSATAEPPQVSIESPDVSMETKLTSDEAATSQAASMNSNGSTESDINEQSKNSKMTSEKKGTLLTHSEDYPDSTENVNSTVASHMPDLIQEVQNTAARAEPFSVADTTDGNSMAQSEISDATPTVGVREADQSPGTSYKPAVGAMMSDTPTISLEDSKTMKTETKTEESENINSQSDASNNNSTDAWFKSMVETTRSKNKRVDMKATNSSSNVIDELNGAEKIYTTIESHNAINSSNNVVDRLNGAERIYTTLESQQGKMVNSLSEPLKVNNPVKKAKSKKVKEKIKPTPKSEKLTKLVKSKKTKKLKTNKNNKIKPTTKSKGQTKLVKKIQKIKPTPTSKGQTKLIKSKKGKNLKNKSIEKIKPTQKKKKPTKLVCEATVDLAFLIDGSSFVGKENFKKNIAFALRVIKNFHIDKAFTHVSVTVFSNQPHVIFDLQAFYSYSSLDKAMKAIVYNKIQDKKIKYTRLGSALEVVEKSVFKDSGRLNIPKMLFVMSSGPSADNVAVPAWRLRNTGVVIYALGMGGLYSPTDLKKIATNPSLDHVVATRYSYLDCLEPWLARHLCSAAGGRLRNVSVLGKARNLIEPKQKTKKDHPTKLIEKKKYLIEKKKKVGEKKEKIKKRLRMRLHRLLSQLGNRKRKDEELFYRSLIYNVNGHRGKDDCKDRHVMCSKWTREGKCEHSAAGFDIQSVQNVCPKSCGICFP